jgi:uncharacterized protein
VSYFTRTRLMTFAISALGVVAFLLLHLPLPLLLGPMLGCLIAAFAGAKLQDSGIFGVFMRTFLGVAVGSSITPAILGQLQQFAGSLIFVPAYIAVIGALGYPLFRYGFGFNHATAWYSAMPGGLQDMLVFGEEAGGDVRALSLIHATRVLVVVTIAPLVMVSYWGVDLTKPPGVAASEIALSQLGLMVFAGLAGWKITERVGLFGASILGPMILTAALSIGGVITHRPPAEIIWASQFFIGIAVGVKYAGITLRELRVCVGAGVVYALLLALISLGFIELIHVFHLAPPKDAFLAYLPGGQAEMVVIAILAGADLAFVVSHHLLRIILVILIGPLVERRLRRPS